MGIWQRLRGTERRQALGSYSDAILSIIQSQATGASALPGATSALESASGFVSRAFASASVSSGMAAVLDAPTLSMIGRSLIRGGEYVGVIKMGMGDDFPRLAPAASYDIAGNEDPSSWIYKIALSGPTMQGTVENVPSAGVVHVRYASSPGAPHRGIGPLQSAHLAGRLSAEVSKALADELSGPRGQLLPLPNVSGDSPEVAALRSDIKGLSGSLAFVESMSDSFGTGPQSNATSGWDVKRVGADIPSGSIEAAKLAFGEVLAACGLSVALFDSSSDSGAREAFRQALHSVLVPLGRLVSSELTAKLGADVQLDFTALGAGDISGRARALQSMVKAGVDISRAMALSGLMIADD